MCEGVRVCVGAVINPRRGQVVHLGQCCRTEAAGIEAEARLGVGNIPSHPQPHPCLVKTCSNLGEGPGLPHSMNQRTQVLYIDIMGLENISQHLN